MLGRLHRAEYNSFVERIKAASVYPNRDTNASFLYLISKMIEEFIRNNYYNDDIYDYSQIILIKLLEEKFGNDQEINENIKESIDIIISYLNLPFDKDFSLFVRLISFVQLCVILGRDLLPEAKRKALDDNLRFYQRSYGSKLYTLIVSAPEVCISILNYFLKFSFPDSNRNSAIKNIVSLCSTRQPPCLLNDINF